MVKPRGLFSGIKRQSNQYQEILHASTRNLTHFFVSTESPPQGTTNESPSMLKYGRNIRTRLNIMKPDLATTVLCKKYGSKAKHCGNEIREFSEGDPVNTRDYRCNADK